MPRSDSDTIRRIVAEAKTMANGNGSGRLWWALGILATTFVGVTLAATGGGTKLYGDVRQNTRSIQTIENQLGRIEDKLDRLLIGRK